jgi:hypothetical protein
MKKNFKNWCEVDNAAYIQNNLPKTLKMVYSKEIILLLLYKHHQFITSIRLDENEDSTEATLYLKDVETNLYPNLQEFLSKFDIKCNVSDLNLVFKLSEEYSNQFDWSVLD